MSERRVRIEERIQVGQWSIREDEDEDEDEDEEEEEDENVSRVRNNKDNNKLEDTDDNPK